MDFTRPLATVTPTLDGDVLMVLARVDDVLTSGQVHRILGGYSEEGIRRVLRRLAGQGVVSSNRIGSAFAYRLNRDHLAAAPVLALANLFREFLARLENLLGGWEVPPVYAAIFGSATGRSMTESSDIDLFVVRPDSVADDLWDRQVACCVATVAAWTGNDLRPLEFTAAELRGRHNEPVLEDVLGNGLTVAGQRAWLTRRMRKEWNE